MKLQTQVSSKDLSTLKELAELDKYKEAKEAEAINAKNQETEEKNVLLEGEQEGSDVVEKINATKCVTTSENCFLKWDNCFLKPDNCCVVKAVRKLTN